MIAYLKGVVSAIFSDCCFIEVQGIGYRVFVSESTRAALKLGSTASLYTHLNVREDAFLLYGFISQKEYSLFTMLTSVNGIGPKVAINILSMISPDNFYAAVSLGDVKLLTNIPGIGKKTAERIIVELKDKVPTWQEELDLSASYSKICSGEIINEAVQALAALGYSNSEVVPEVKKHAKQAQTVQELVKLVLKEFGGK